MAAARHLFEADQRFVAYAAHELRSEITVQLALAEATLADPNADTATLRDMGEGVAAGCLRQERLVDALLTLARSQHGHLRRDRVDLAAIAAEALRAHDHQELTTTVELGPARTTGDPDLIGRLVANLVSNAIRHNSRGGRLDVATQTAAGRATFTIANTGQVVPTGDVPRLFQPFQQLSPRPRPSADGVGLGLAIVQAIADAHLATVTAEGQAGGGLRISIDFPAEPRQKSLAAPAAALTAVGPNQPHLP